MTKRKQQALQTRKKILNCALDLFEKKGYDEVTIQEIAAAAQTSVGSIYRYFQSKEEIAAQNAEPLDDIYHAFFQKLLTEDEYQGMSAIRKLELFYLYIQDVVSSYDNLRSLYVYNLKNPQSKTLLTDFSRELFQDYLQLIQECRDEGSVRPDLSDQAYLDIFLQSSRGLLLDWLLRNKDFDFASQAKFWWKIVYSYIRND